jgi:hypothetical protein
VPVLNFIKPFLVKGSILLFDDWNQLGDASNDASGERRAVKEFLENHQSFRIDHLFDYGWEGTAYRVVAL